MRILQADIDTYIALVALQWNFHDLILGVKSQVKTLYGPDSDEVASLGLKKKFERKTRPRVNRATAGV